MDIDPIRAPTEEQHQEEEDQEARVAAEDVDEVIDDQDDGDTPMDEDDDDDDEHDNVGDLPQASAQDGQIGGEGQEEFEDTSIAAFYSHRKSLFALALHPAYPNPPLALSGGEDDGGWIWDTREGADVVQLGGHTDSVTAVGWNAAGDLAATGGMDGKVRVWKRAGDGSEWSKWEFLASLEGPDEVVWLAWHPKGNVLASGGSDGTVWMWQLPTGNVMNVFSGHTAAVTVGQWTPDGKKLVTVSEDGSLIIWDPRNAAPMSKLQPTDSRFNMQEGITALSISTDGRVVIVGSANGEVRLVNIAALDQGGAAAVVGVLKGHVQGESIEAVLFVDLLGTSTTAAPGPPTHAITASTEGKAIVWDLASSKMRCEVMHDAAITTLALHPGSPLFTTSSADHTARTWDARTGACVATHKGFTDGVLALAVGKDDGFTQGAESGGIGAYAQKGVHGWKIVGAGDEGVALVFRV